MTAQTLEQKRAKHALDQIRKLKQAGSYVKYVNALPAAILMNGLGQALATERAASDPAHKELAKHVAKWLLSPEAHTRYANSYEADGAELDDAQRLLCRIVAGDQHAYVWAQVEAIAYVTWLKKFANAFLESSGEE